MPRLEPLTIAACLCGAWALAAPSLAGADAHDSASYARPAPVDIVVTGFVRSESALHDTLHDVYLVSNITNGPRDEDNSGFISRIAPDGQVLARRWIEGGVNGVTLNAPKGMALAGGVLYVADIDHLRKFDAVTGAPLGSVSVPGSTFLNDVTSDDKGNVFFTDIGFTTVPVFGESGTDAVYKLASDGVLSVVAAGNSLLNHPNGVAVLPNGDLKVATYDPFQGTKEIYTIDKRGNKRDVIPLPTGLLDGIVVLPQGFLVSSWVDFGTATYKPGKVYFVRRDGRAVEVASGFENPSDIGYDFERNRLLVPELPDPDNRGTLTIRTLKLP